MRIVFMGTPQFSVPALERLIESEHQVVAVYTQPDRVAGRRRVPAPSLVKRTALEHSLEVLQPVKLRDPAEVERLAALKPDIIVAAAFGQLLPQSVLDIPNFGCLNIHPSLLPRYRGASPIAAAILAGDEKTGVSIMLMDAGLDTGPILSQSLVTIELQDTTGSLTINLAQAGARLLAETLPLWFDHLLTPQPQDERSASYTTLISKDEGEIDWHLAAIEIWRRVRAFNPWPGCYTWWQGKLLKILEAIPFSPFPRQERTEPGKVVSIGDEAKASARLGGSEEVKIGVETGDGVLGLLQVQLEGKRALPAAEFLRGQKGFVGGLLGSKTLS